MPRTAKINLFMTLGIIVALPACGGDGPSGLSEGQSIEGRYAGLFAAVFTNSVETDDASAAITITLDRPSSAGAFSGSYIIGNGGGSGTISGYVRSDGGVSITHFGDPSVSAAQNLAFLQSQFNWCNIGGAASSGMNGSVLGNRLNVGGTLAFQCSYTDGVNTYQVATQLTISIVADR